MLNYIHKSIEFLNKYWRFGDLCGSCQGAPLSALARRKCTPSIQELVRDTTPFTKSACAKYRSCVDGSLAQGPSGASPCHPHKTPMTLNIIAFSIYFGIYYGITIRRNYDYSKVIQKWQKPSS